ncbi:MAG: efflux RND transporter permease subunit [Myxococcota bacterium]
MSIEIRGFDMQVLESLAVQAADIVKDIPGVTDVDASRDTGVPQQAFHIDRSKAADLGLSARDITSALQTAIAGSEAGEFQVGNSFSYNCRTPQACPRRHSRPHS